MHAAALVSWNPSALIGGWNRTQSKGASFFQRFGGRLFNTVDDVLNADEVTAVLIATSTDSHFDIASRALRAGKHVLLEKPLCKTREEIAQLIEVANDSGKICMPSHNYIYEPDMRRMRSRLKAGDMGKALSYWAFFNNIHSDEAGIPDLVMRELMVHHAYSLLYFLGRPSKISATATNVHFSDPEAHDQISLTATFDYGAIATLWGSFAADDRTREPWSVYFKLFGSEGTAMTAWDRIKYGPEEEPLWDDSGYRDSFLFTQQYFLSECVAKNANPLSTLQDALDAASILDAARESLRTGMTVEIGYNGDAKLI